MSEINVLIVEDEPLIAENIAHYLNNNDFKVCGIAYDDVEAIDILATGVVDAAVLDINLESHMDGIELAAMINAQYAIPFVFLTSYADKRTLDKAKKVQPWGYIVKPFNEQTVLATLEMAVWNFAHINSSAHPDISADKINRQLLNPVSEREYEVLQLIYNGKTNQQIADALFVSVNTVKKHINSAYLKLATNSRSSAIVRMRNLCGG